MKKAYSYLRVSTKSQVEEGLGIEIQRSSILDYCKIHDLEVVRFFTDEGVSGTLQDRPALLEMIREIDNNGVRDVVVYKEDRLSRQLEVAIYLEGQFMKRKVKLHCSAEPNFDNPTDPMQKAYRHIRNVFAELEKDTITSRLLAGRKQKASHGEYAGGRPPFGYSINGKGNLILNHSEAKVVSQIFSLRKKLINNKPMTMERIAHKLNKAGVRVRGKMVYPSSVQYILNNKIYTGLIRYGTVRAQGVHTPIL